jgi:hypothetical protein
MRCDQCVLVRAQHAVRNTEQKFGELASLSNRLKWHCPFWASGRATDLLDMNIKMGLLAICSRLPFRNDP